MMIHLKRFESFQTSEYKSIPEHLRYVDLLIESSIINESTIINVDKIKKIWNKILDRVSKLPNDVKKKVIIYGIASLMTIGSFKMINDIIRSHSTEDVIVKDAIDVALTKFKDPTTLRVSDNGRSHIKEHEGLKLKAYRLGDNKITVGYGHAEPISKSKFRNGQEISKDLAEKLFTKDLTKTADAVRKMFSQWKEEGNDIRITQSQFDAIVSMAYNIGINGLRKTEFIRQLKSGNLKKAGELIKTTKTSKRFPGLKKRREKEAKMFLST